MDTISYPLKISAISRSLFLFPLATTIRISPFLPHLPALLYFFILYSKRAA